MNREVTLLAGGVGFGSDPKRQMDEDLMRVKSLIETGDASHDAAENRSRTLGASAR